MGGNKDLTAVNLSSGDMLSAITWLVHINLLSCQLIFSFKHKYTLRGNESQCKGLVLCVHALSSSLL